MAIVERPFKDNDLDRVFDLLGRCRRAGYVDMELLSTNLRLTLLNPDFDRDQTLLLEHDRQLIGFALLWQGKYLGLLVDPRWRGELERRALAWAERQLIDAGQHDRLVVLCRDDDRLMARFCEERGFVIDDEELRMGRRLNGPLPITSPPPGFVIRPMQGAAELEAWLDLYAEAFGRRVAKLRHWRAMRADADHNPALDLVAVTDSGRLAGICYCSIAAFEMTVDSVIDGRTEPIAVGREFQRQGLGHALVSTGLTSLRAHGAGIANLTTEADNVAAHRFYATLGYDVLYRARWYGRSLAGD